MLFEPIGGGVRLEGTVIRLESLSLGRNRRPRPSWYSVSPKFLSRISDPDGTELAVTHLRPRHCGQTTRPSFVAPRLLHLPVVDFGHEHRSGRCWTFRP